MLFFIFFLSIPLLIFFFLHQNVVADPVQSVRQDGLSASSLGKGVASGLTGLVTKPTAGVLGFVSKTAEVCSKVLGFTNFFFGFSFNFLQGVSATTESGSQVARKRVPRYFGPDKVCLLEFCFYQSFFHFLPFRFSIHLKKRKIKLKVSFWPRKLDFFQEKFSSIKFNFVCFFFNLIFIFLIILMNIFSFFCPASTRPSFLKQKRMIITTKRVLISSLPVVKKVCYFFYFVHFYYI